MSKFLSKVVSIFMLANSWVGQNSGSIELYFLFYFRMACGCVAESAEAKNRRKKKTGRNPPGPIGSDRECTLVNWAVRSIGCAVRLIGQSVQKWESLLF